LKKKVEAMDGCPGYIREILQECLEVAEYAEEALVEQAFDEIRSQIHANLEYIEAIVLEFNIFVDSDPSDIAGVPAGSLDPGTKYNSDLNFAYSMEEAGKGFDARAFFEAMGKKILEKTTGQDVVIENSGGLPSELLKWIPAGGGAREFAVESTGESTESAQREFDGFSDAAASAAEPVFFELIFNEYILSHCSFETGADEKRDEAGNFFKNEVEYILWGSKSQNLNCFYTKSALMTARFALNAIHVYSDSEKKLKSDALAAATAGWWTAGAGIPVMSNLIKCSWAIAEAGIDTGNLFSGYEIAVIKRSADWITDIGLKSAGIKTPAILCMDYRDYLRLFLIGVPKDIKAARLLDIIALDAPGDFNVFNAFTEVCVEATVTFRSIAGGRHEVKIKVVRSY
ncbi:MAG: hypothetical protein JXB33_00605, partial [Clostridia bacterium]|nr:hypothetical protein [Clostridia bacterium]